MRKKVQASEVTGRKADLEAEIKAKEEEAMKALFS